MDEQPGSRDPRKIARDIDAQMAADEVAEWLKVGRTLRFRWFEVLLLSGLFAFGIGVGATIVYAVPVWNELLYRFMVFWLLGFLVVVIFCFEFLIRRFRALRRFYELNLRRVERLEERVKELEAKTASKASADGG